MWIYGLSGEDYGNLWHLEQGITGDFNAWTESTMDKFPAIWQVNKPRSGHLPGSHTQKTPKVSVVMLNSTKISPRSYSGHGNFRQVRFETSCAVVGLSVSLTLVNLCAAIYYDIFSKFDLQCAGRTDKRPKRNHLAGLWSGWNQCRHLDDVPFFPHMYNRWDAGELQTKSSHSRRVKFQLPELSIKTSDPKMVTSPSTWRGNSPNPNICNRNLTVIADKI